MNPAQNEAAKKQWLDFALATRGNSADSEPPVDENNLRETLADAWDDLPLAFQTGIGPAIAQVSEGQQATIETRRSVKSKEKKCPGPIEVVGKGFRYADDVNVDEAGSAFGAYMAEASQYVKALQDLIERLQALRKVLMLCLGDGAKAVAGSMESASDVLAVTKEELKIWQSTIDDFEEMERPKHDEAVATRRMEDARKELGLSESWVGSWPLGTGSFATAAAWVKQDISHTITDRVAVKTSFIPEENVIWTEKKEFWSPNPQDPTGNSSIPNEVVAMYKLRSRLGADNIVRIRNFSIEEPLRMIRLHLEYCPHGDLSSKTNFYDALYEVEPTPEKWGQWHADRQKLPREWLPEAFLWHTFECLATAGMLMEHGELNPHTLIDWDPIVHRDLKAANIFLGSAANDRYHGYPVPKIGDFGLCSFEKGNAVSRPSKYNLCGSPYNLAPEQAKVKVKSKGRGKGVLHFLSSKTNVWGVGMVLWSLVEGEDGDHRLQWEPWTANERTPWHFDPERVEEPTFRENSRQQYSVELLELISACLRFDQKDRISFKKLLRRVRRYTIPKSGKKDFSNGMRSAPASSAAFSDGPHAIKYKSDKYAIGSRLIDKEPPKGFIYMPEPAHASDSHSETDDEPDQPRTRSEKTADASSSPQAGPSTRSKRDADATTPAAPREASATSPPVRDPVDTVPALNKAPPRSRGSGARAEKPVNKGTAPKPRSAPQKPDRRLQECKCRCKEKLNCKHAKCCNIWAQAQLEAARGDAAAADGQGEGTDGVDATTAGKRSAAEAGTSEGKRGGSATLAGAERNGSRTKRSLEEPSAAERPRKKRPRT